MKMNSKSKGFDMTAIKVSRNATDKDLDLAGLGKHIGCAILTLLTASCLALAYAKHAQAQEDSGYTFYDSPLKSVKQEQSEPAPADLQNARYCEIFPVYHDDATGRTISEAFNTFLLNDCPNDLWAELGEKVKDPNYLKQFETDEIDLNGPRRWMMNQIKQQPGSVIEHKVATFIDDPELGLLQATIGAQIDGNDFGGTLYTEQVVHRWTQWIYNAGTTVYELTDHVNEKTYIMQSILDEKVAFEDLPAIADKLELPENWTFESRVLEEEYNLVTCGYAYVIKDNLLNGYQRKANNTCDQ